MRHLFYKPGPLGLMTLGGNTGGNAKDRLFISLDFSSLTFNFLINFTAIAMQITIKVLKGKDCTIEVRMNLAKIK